MEKNKNRTLEFQQGLEKLGFEGDNALFLVDESTNTSNPEIEFLLERAKQDFKATAVFVRKQLNGSFVPQVYIYDYTDRGFDYENENDSLIKIQKQIWSSGEVPLACIIYNTEIKIINCTTHIDKNLPKYLIESLQISAQAHRLYNEQFAVKIKTGVFWEQEEFKNNFQFKNSSYDVLIKNIRFVGNKLKDELHGLSILLINKIIVQSILIKYLEERIDSDGNKLLSEKYFKKYNGANSFGDVLRNKKFVELLSDLNDHQTGFNGNVFAWDEEDKLILQDLDLSMVADLLDTDRKTLSSDQMELNFPDWRYFEFKYIPVELISRLYEEFLGENKHDKGMYYTPAHLAKLLVDECIPLKKYKEFDVQNFKVLDPACGSGIFLVIVFKRLVQIWRLQNDMKSPELRDLKAIMHNLYGIDKEEQAVNLASFSLVLALCNELKPVKIINELKFDDLRKDNVVRSNFFDWINIRKIEFDLIIGNPPFRRGALDKSSNIWNYEGKKIQIPQNQIALKFLSESIPFLKDSGLLCLIIKSSSLLYNTSSEKYKKILFSNFNIIQLFDFTALARNNSLWDNGTDVATTAIFLRNEKPDIRKNILHLTFRRTKATIERITFEIDDYDLHFVNRNTAINNHFVWKNNLLGGGRIKGLVQKFETSTKLKEYLKLNNYIISEGYIKGNNGKHKPQYIYTMKTLPTEAITENLIDYSKLDPIDRETTFVQMPPEILFTAPNIIIWENIGEERLPVFFNKRTFSFKDKLIAIASNKKDISKIESLYKLFDKHNDFFRFYIFASSSQLLVNKNTSILLKDVQSLPIELDDSPPLSCLSSIDKNIIKDVNTTMQLFLRNGENSDAIKPIKAKEFEKIMIKYGEEFSEAINQIYGKESRRFRLSKVIELENSFIATVFRYDDNNSKPQFHKDLTELNLPELTDYSISAQLTSNRILKLYPAKDTVVFIKPNQLRYWIPLIAYRDADKCFSDFVKAGF